MKKGNLLVVALHSFVLAVFLLLQGCATGDCPIDWLNWPYNSPAEEPLMLPLDADDGYPDTVDYTDIVSLPPVFAEDEPVVTVIDEPVSVEPTPSPSDSDQVYVVKKGDTLSGVASMYGTTWKKLSEYNSLTNPNKLLVGQKISIPGSLSASAPSSRSSAPKAKVSSKSKSSIPQGTSYVIQRGDTLSGIAQRSGLSVSEIKAANALNSNSIVAGKSLSIPRKNDVNVKVHSEPVALPKTTPKASPESKSSSSSPVDSISTAIEESPELKPAPLADDIAPLAPSDSAPVYEHVLYPGETLDDVARQYSSSKEEIMILNGIVNSDDVKPGTKLLVPLPE